MKRIILILFGVQALTANAASYFRQVGECNFSGYQEDIDTPRFALPFKITATMSMTGIAETGEIVRSQFNGWETNPAAPALDEKLLLRMNEYSFYHFNGTKEIWLYQFTTMDWLRILQTLGGGKIDLNDQYTFSALEWSSGYSRKFASPMDVKFGFGIFSTDRLSFVMQIHLPPTKKNGLSFHLVGECSFRNAP